MNVLPWTQAIFARVLQQHRAGIVRPQVAAGRSFDGPSFQSKPRVIHFKARAFPLLLSLSHHTHTQSFSLSLHTPLSVLVQQRSILDIGSDSRVSLHVL